MRYNNIFIGSRLMETITSGLYDGNLNCIREYIQNGIDSGANNIDIFFENGESDLIIKDDGSGMGRAELEESLGIGTSHKTDDYIGWRGIGIWSGVPVCKRIVIITKRMNDKKYRIEINNDIIREDHLSNKSILDILSMATGEIEKLPLGKGDSYEEDHFTVIRLESILPTQRYVFDDKQIVNYLSSEAPVPFDKNVFVFAAEIEDWLQEMNVIFPTTIIRYNGKKIFRPPFRNDIFLNKLIKKEFFVKGKLTAIGWFLTGIQNEKLRKPNCGIFFKKKGFTIGDTNLVLRQFSGTYHPWQYGEIHIISRDLRENAARNNFEYNSGDVGLFLDSVGEFIRHLEQLNRYKSQKTSPKQFEKIKDILKNKKHLSIEADLLAIKERQIRPASFTSEPSIQVMKEVIDSEFDRYTSELNTIQNQLNELDLIDDNKSTIIEDNTITIDRSIIDKHNNAQTTEVLNDAYRKDISTTPLNHVELITTNKRISLENASEINPSTEADEGNINLSMRIILNSVCPQVKSSLTRVTKKGLEFPAMSLTDPIRDLLKEKIGLDNNEIIQLSQAAYGWEKVTAMSKPPLLLIDPAKDNHNENKHLNRNLRFGVMIYTIHDLFVNLNKHEKGRESLQWFEFASKEEKEILKTEMIFIIDFICRLIDKSKKS